MTGTNTFELYGVSIHAPVMDANSSALAFKPLLSGFNPRARDGREPPVDPDEPTDPVSIHAPVMDAKTHQQWSM